MASVEEQGLVKQEKEPDKREAKLIDKAVAAGFPKKEAARLLKLYGGKRLADILKRAKSEGGALGSKSAMARAASVAMSDSLFRDMAKTQGVSWMKVVDGVKVKLRLDLLMIYNGALKGPRVRLVNRTQKEIIIDTHGVGMVINLKGDWAMFGLLPPNGKEWSAWEPCFFAGDPTGKKAYTRIKSVADGFDTTKEQREIIEGMDYKMTPIRKGPTGLPIALLKRAANDTIKLAGFEGKPGWQDGIDLRDGEHPENAIALVQDEKARHLLERFWFVDADEDDDEEEDDDDDIWDD